MMFEPSALIWIDFETSSAANLKAAGAFNYACDDSTAALVLAYAIGDAPAAAWHADGAMLDWAEAPPELRAAIESGRMAAAFNAGFDRAIWNFATLDFPYLPADRIIDVRVQAEVSGLPADLHGASQRLGGPGKQPDGKALIKLFSVDRADPAAHPEAWRRFLTYAVQDVEVMRGIYLGTRRLPLAEWREYAAFEAINERGIGIDVPYVERAAALAAEDRRHLAKRLAELTGGVVTAVTQVGRIAGWIHRTLPDSEARALLEAAVAEGEDEDPEDEETGCAPAALKLSFDRKVIDRLLAFLETKTKLSAVERKVVEVATLRQYGGSAAPAKFTRLLAQHVGGTVRQQYVFAGAPQTGRASSRGAQIQNLTRETLGAAEAATVDLIADGCSHAELAAAEPADVPVARKLALLVRPAIVAGLGNVLVWSDWSAIEARVLPWLACSEGAQELLDVFAAADADPTLPDVYMHSAAGIVGKPAAEIDKRERQTGKIATLALGFGGARRALQSMAAGYRLYLSDADAGDIVGRWRAANAWAPVFWSALWDAAMNAWAAPGVACTAGRIAFVFDPTYLGGTLFLALPSGRLLTYPRPAWREVPVLDADGKEIDRRLELTFRRAWGRARLWHGTFAENATQAAAADLLRGTLTRLENDPALTFMPVRMHTHDEILTEIAITRTNEARAILHDAMLAGFDWSYGLPLAAEETVSFYYSKAVH
jgi:DNA polymerase bacteriophage-type